MLIHFCIGGNSAFKKILMIMTCIRILEGMNSSQMFIQQLCDIFNSNDMNTTPSPINGTMFHNSTKFYCKLSSSFQSINNSYQNQINNATGNYLVETSSWKDINKTNNHVTNYNVVCNGQGYHNINVTCSNILTYLTNLHNYSSIYSPTILDTTTSQRSNNSTNNITWFLGYSTESCTQTCNRFHMMCQSQYFQYIDSLTEFQTVLQNSYNLVTGAKIGNSSRYCNQINGYLFAEYPAVASFVIATNTTWILKTYCQYPITPNAYLEDCSLGNLYPPSQRLCPCSNQPTCIPTYLPTLVPSTSNGNHSFAAPTMYPTLQYKNNHSTTPSNHGNSTTPSPTPSPTTSSSIMMSASPSMKSSNISNDGNNVSSVKPTLYPSIQPSIALHRNSCYASLSFSILAELVTQNASKVSTISKLAIKTEQLLINQTNISLVTIRLDPWNNSDFLVSIYSEASIAVQEIEKDSEFIEFKNILESSATNGMFDKVMSSIRLYDVGNVTANLVRVNYISSNASKPTTTPTVGTTIMPTVNSSNLQESYIISTHSVDSKLPMPDIIIIILFVCMLFLAALVALYRFRAIWSCHLVSFHFKLKKEKDNINNQYILSKLHESRNSIESNHEDGEIMLDELELRTQKKYRLYDDLLFENVPSIPDQKEELSYYNNDLLD